MIKSSIIAAATTLSVYALKLMLSWKMLLFLRLYISETKVCFFSGSHPTYFDQNTLPIRTLV